MDNQSTILKSFLKLCLCLLEVWSKSFHIKDNRILGFQPATEIV